MITIMNKKINVLLSSVGRRCELVRIFKEALLNKGNVYTADCDFTAPGLYVSDKSFLVPPVESNNYVDYLIGLCKKYRISFLVPLIDPELIIISKHRKKFIESGIMPLISSYKVVSLAYDKYKTAMFFKENKIPTPETRLVEERSILKRIKFPVIIKPRFGSASVGVQRCDNINDYIYFRNKLRPAIVQEYLKGSEITVDVLCDFKGKLLLCVQRKRLKIRGGEVERAVTIKNDEIKKWIVKIINLLKPIGVINIQCFDTEEGIYFTEINPRFGGGYPLSKWAGANFPKILLTLLEGKKYNRNIIDDYKAGCYMLRFDNAIYLDQDDDRLLSIYKQGKVK